MADHADLADLHRLETNDISATLRFLGVEAARAALVREVRAVFGAYGIAVDARHLSLIADFMTSQACPGWPAAELHWQGLHAWTSVHQYGYVAQPCKA